MNEYLSYSQISMYTRCGMQYYYRYIENKRIPPGIALVKGRSAHQGFEFNFKQKIESHEDLPKKDVTDFTISGYENIIENEEVFLTKEEKESNALDKVKDDLVGVIDIYSDEVAPEIQPTDVEVKHTVEIPDCRPLVAIVDCIDNKENVIDFKVTGRAKPQSDADNSLQLTFYALAYQDRFGKMPNSLNLNSIVTTKKMKYSPLVTKRDDGDIITAVRVIQAVQKGIKSEVFLPPAEGSWVCSPTYCGFYKICKFKNKKSF